MPPSPAAAELAAAPWQWQQAAQQAAGGTPGFPGWGSGGPPGWEPQLPPASLGAPSSNAGFAGPPGGGQYVAAPPGYGQLLSSSSIFLMIVRAWHGPERSKLVHNTRANGATAEVPAVAGSRLSAGSCEQRGQEGDPGDALHLSCP
jgi:hypothetical protein